MTSEGSVATWIRELQAGDEAAAQSLWERYFSRLMEHARAALKDAPRRVADEEDVALSAFDSFCHGARNGRFPKLSDRQDLWRLLVVLTARKAGRTAQREKRQKRGGGRVVCETDLSRHVTGDETSMLDQLIGPEPTPQFAAEVVEQIESLVERLNDAQLRTVALRKLEGYTNIEIAAALQCAPRTIERKLNRIRAIWFEEFEQ